MIRNCAYGSYSVKSLLGCSFGAIFFMSMFPITSLSQGKVNFEKSFSSGDGVSLPSTDNPIVITSGGTYSGTWSSNDPKKPAVTIRTDELVILQNSVITSSNGANLISLSGVTHRSERHHRGRDWVCS